MNTAKMSSAFYWVPQGPDSFDFYFDNIADFHGSDTAGGSGTDNIARIQGHTLGKIMNEEGNGKDHIAGKAFLDLLSV